MCGDMLSVQQLRDRRQNGKLSLEAKRTLVAYGHI